MSTLLVLLALLAPAPKKQWSEQYGVGVYVPRGWKILQRDERERVLVFEGPLIGQGIPHVALSVVGGATSSTLTGVADRLIEQVNKKQGWRMTARKQRRIGPWPAERVGYAFTTVNGVKGRARFTVVLLGMRYYALEITASAKHFPGSTFDAIEKSLEVRWNKTRLAGGGVLSLPNDWELERDGLRLRVAGPAMGEGTNLLTLEPGSTAAARHPKEQAGPKLKFAGKARTTRELADLDDRPKPNRTIVIEAADWTGILTLAGPATRDLFPVHERILADFKPPSK